MPELDKETRWDLELSLENEPVCELPGHPNEVGHDNEGVAWRVSFICSCMDQEFSILTCKAVHALLMWSVETRSDTVLWFCNCGRNLTAFDSYLRSVPV